MSDLSWIDKSRLVSWHLNEREMEHIVRTAFQAGLVRQRYHEGYYFEEPPPDEDDYISRFFKDDDG